MKSVEETFQVKGESPVKAQLKFTRHGPVIYEDLAHRKAYALRAAYLEHEGTAVYLAALRINQARNWQEFLMAMDKHYCPSLNMVYADVDGNIGWMGGSIAPIRPNWTGLLPVPGNGDYEWAGYLDTKKLPKVLNPPEGFFASANQYNLPDGYPYADVSNREWTDPYRYDRIMEVLGSGRRITVGDSMRLQLDELSLPARELVPLLGSLRSEDADTHAALKLLQNWDYVLSRTSAAAAVYELWVSRLHENVFQLYVPASAKRFFGDGNRRVLIRLLYNPDGAFGPDPIAGRDSILIKSLEEAVATLKGKLGPDMAKWEWGTLHHMAYDHMLTGAVDQTNKNLINVTSLPRGGDGYTVNNTGYRPSDYRQNTGPSYRQVIDLGDWDNSVTVNSPGQSGDPNTRHYKDLFPLWADGKYFPLFYSRGKIESVTEEVLILQPTK